MQQKLANMSSNLAFRGDIFISIHQMQAKKELLFNNTSTPEHWARLLERAVLASVCITSSSNLPYTP
jgi:hypothetical protein